VFIVDVSWGFEEASFRSMLHGNFWKQRLDGTGLVPETLNFVKIERLYETSVPDRKISRSTFFLFFLLFKSQKHCVLTVSSFNVHQFYFFPSLNVLIPLGIL